MIKQPITPEEIAKQESLKKAMDSRVTRDVDNEDVEYQDTRVLHSMQTEGKHMDRKFFKNIDSTYLM